MIVDLIMFIVKQMKGETVASIIIIIITIVILVVYVIFAYYAASQRIYPFTVYVMDPPDNSTVYGANQVNFTQEQIDNKKQSAIDACEYIANSQNFMTMYCGREPTKTIDCSKLKS